MMVGTPATKAHHIAHGIHFRVSYRDHYTMYVQRNNEEHSCDHCCNGKAISITHSKKVFVALGIQHAMRMRHTAICGLPGSTKFFHIVSHTAGFYKIRY